MRCRVGIDVGGTFTDLALLSEQGDFHVLKVPTRPSDIAGGCLEGLANLLAATAISPAEVDYWSHGSTVATNAIVERRGARTALLVTDGFRDILEIRRQIKPDRYNLRALKPEPMVPRHRCLEVRERILWDGSVRVPLSENQLEATLDLVEELGVESIAVCFLHAYVNATHEKAVLERIQKRLPTIYVSASHEVSPEFREYARCATTVTNAYVGPVMERYLERFDEGGRAMGIRLPLTIFQSNGGITSASGAARLPVKVLYSGPAAGVQGAVHVATEAGYTNVIAFDMGGTSCDVCLIRDGAPLLAAQRELGGFPVRTPMIDVHSIGAGGGSIAWLDDGGLLQVGPQSAGADPGPSCYGQGGTTATVTDANVVLGRLNPESLLGGALRVHKERAQVAVAALAKPLDFSLEEAALGILDVVNSNMMGAIRVVSVERGYDYRDCALVAFGGAGPLHAVDIAREMGIKTVLVPWTPGILCAMGLLFADYRSDFTGTRILRAKDDQWLEMRDVFEGLAKRSMEWAVRHGIPANEAELNQSVSMRYVGQSHQLPVPAPTLTGPRDVETLVTAFHEAHRAAYGYAQPNASVETVDFQVTLLIRVPRPQISPADMRRGIANLSAARIGDRLVWFHGSQDPIMTPIYQRAWLPAECTLQGPAILEQLDTTTLVPPRAAAVVDTVGNVHITLS